MEPRESSRRSYSLAGAPSSPGAVLARSGSIVPFGLIALFALLALTASPAMANSHVFTTTFGSATSTPANPYPLSHPADVAVDLSNHDVYVADTGAHRIEKFDSSGHLLLMFGEEVNRTQVLAKAPAAQRSVCDPSVDECQEGTPSFTPGGFAEPTFIAVDNSSGPSAGDVYVGDTGGNGLVSKFEPSGHLIPHWGEGGQLVRTNGINGIAVNPAGDFIVMSGIFEYKISRYSQSGELFSEFAVPYRNGTEAHGLAVGANEHFYKGGNEELPEVTEFNEGVIAASITHGPITGLAADPWNNDLYTDEQGSFISHFRLGCGESCSPLESFGGGKLSGARLLALDLPSDNVYVANSAGNDIVVFDGVGPYVTTGQASSVGRTTATLTGHLAEGGRGAIIGCHFEYGTSETYESGPVPCVPSTPYGSEATVTAELTGLQPESTYHYRLVASNAAGAGEGADGTLTPHFVLEAQTGPATNLTNTSANLTGSYTGDGHDTKYHFEYGSTVAYGETTPEQDGGAEVGPQAALAPITGLQPGATYHYRVVATNSFGTTYGQDRVLATFDRPAIETVSTSGVTATGAELHAAINPQGSDTKYHFEYGTTTGYGLSAPSPAEDIGSAAGNQRVSVTLTDLQAGSTYHFRVVAENGYGKTVSEDQDFGFYPAQCPNSTLRQETDSNYLPDCRAYELVSPADAGGTSLYPLGPNSAEATNPSRLAFGGWLDAIPGAGDPVNVFGDLYVSTRTDQGWVTKYVGIPGDQTNDTNGPPGEVSNGRFLTSPEGVRTNLSMSKFLDWNINNFGFASVNPPPDFAPHVWAADGTSLGEWPTAPGQPAGPYLNQSPDLSHYYFISGGAVTQRYGEYEELFTYEGGTAYDNNVEGGIVMPIAFDSAGGPIGVKAVPQTSTDGSRVLMSTATCEDPAASSCSPGELFMRVGDAVTYDIASGHAVQYVGMTADGSEVYFTSPERLTPSDTDTSSDLYMWSEETKSLTLISAGSGGSSGNSDACSVSWVEKCGVMPIVNNNFSSNFSKGDVLGNGLSDNAVASASGDIYFLSPERLSGTRGVANEANLYLYRQGTLQYVTTLEPGSFCESEWPYPCSAGPIIRIQVSPDGEHMAFLTASRVTAYDNAHHTEMYTYSPNTEEVLCVSCRPNGAPPTSDVWASSNGRFMTNDGRTFFSTGDSLVPRDTDGLRDVYEYVEGRPQLISSGTSSKDSEKVLAGINYGLYISGLIGVSANGADAYFSTYDSLVPQDRNGGFQKFYDARTDGGFTFSVPAAPCEAADECVGSGSSPEATPPDTSGAQLGGGNLRAQAATHHRKRSVRHHHKAKRSRHHTDGATGGGRGRHRP